MATIEGSSNFFYTFKISTSGGTRSIDLTEQINRSIDSVAITEVFTGASSQEGDTLTLTLKQMDYLPEDNQRRPTESAVFGQVTNRTGSLLDLRFDREKGFTFVTQSEIQSGRTAANRTTGGISEDVVFVFDRDNVIELTWGYQTPSKQRTKLFRIIAVDMISDVANEGSIVIQANDIGINQLQRNKAREGVTFIDRTQRKQTLKQTLGRLTTAVGLGLVFDGEEVNLLGDRENLGIPFVNQADRARTNQNDTLNVGDVPFRMHRGQSLMKFIKTLASDYDSYTRVVIPEKGTLQEKIKNIKLEFSKIETLFKDSNPDYTLTYRGTGNEDLVRGFKINVALDANSTTASSAVDQETGKKSSSLDVSDTLEAQLVQEGDQSSTEQQIRVPNKNTPEAKQNFEKQLGSKPTGHSATVPYNDAEGTEHYTRARQTGPEYIAGINVNVVGDPDYQPGAYRINNIGARFSGVYRIYSVTHTLGLNGYECVLQGKSRVIAEGGVSAKALASENQLQQEDIIEAQLIEP